MSTNPTLASAAAIDELRRGTRTDHVAGRGRLSAIPDDDLCAPTLPERETSSATVPTVSILGVPISRLAGDQALEVIDEWAEGGICQTLAYVNAHTLNVAVSVPALRRSLERSRLVMNDGVGLNLAARMCGARFPENLNGSDFTVRLLQLAASREWGVYFLGGEPGVAELAAARLEERINGLRVVGVSHGFTDASDELLAQRVRQTGASLLVVALGSPLQEIWLDGNLQSTGALVGIGVGAFLDFTAGRVRRAPRWMNALGIEWCFRLLQEPRRLWRRYLVGNPLFLLRAWRDRHRSASIEQERVSTWQAS